MKRPISDLITHLKQYKDAVLIVGSKTLQRELPQQDNEEEEEGYVRKEPLFFQPGESSRNVFSRKTMVKNPNMFWQFYKQMILKDPEESLETYDTIKEFINMDLIKSVIDFNTDGLLKDVKPLYIPMKGNRNIVQCVKCNKTYNVSDINLNTEKPIICSDIEGDCKGKIKPTIPFYGEKYDTINITNTFHEIFTYDDNDVAIGLNTHTLILIGTNFTEDLLDEIIRGYNQFKTRQNDAFSVFITDNDDMFMNSYLADFGTTYDINESVKKLIDMLKE